MIIGLSWGFSGALFLGAGVYVGVGVLFATAPRRHPVVLAERAFQMGRLANGARPHVSMTSTVGRTGQGDRRR
jgi:hypothetical protein